MATHTVITAHRLFVCLFSERNRRFSRAPVSEEMPRILL